MDFINEEDTWYDLSTAFLSPFCNLLVNLFTNFWLDLTNVTSEESHEALRARVNDIDLVESNCVHDLLSLLELTFGALNEASLRSDIVEVTAAGE